ncbi:carbohydrate ABC transporter substrate-binding protein, CUT1 family [Clostridium amylolyticum]|uniref:Carbohydrate ABC transporter substrate-binding protein, CUT1 family n=1 Tax=Clostridium amylolyticum TaxID=1121298 RepID=A0A1M6B5U1_9CLOT|nr:ABC transporter substrate-binding protein [Clostridium amylolyticum]SHI43938.1 carbohydrate ABC transporter substrate-binding protein, CUT1 family [Clostridium amylolyticum]
MKKKILSGILCLMFLVSGCSDKTKKENSDLDNKLKGNITIWSTEKHYAFLKSSSEKFQTKYPEVKINLQQKTTEEVNNNFLEGYLKAEEKPDVITIKSNFISLYSEDKELFEPLNNIISPYEKNFYKGRLDEVKKDSQYVAFPMDSNPAALLYRRDILDAAEIYPEDINTWNRFIEGGEKLKASFKGQKKMLGISSKNYNEVVALLANELSMETYFKESNMTSTISKYEKILNVLKKLSESSNIAIFQSEEELLKSFTEGNIGFIVGYPEYIPKLVSEKPNYGIKQLPSFEPGGNNNAQLPAYNLALLKNSEDKEIAQKFVEFTLTNSDALVESMLKYGNFPAYIPTYSHSDFDNKIDCFSKQKVYSIFEISYKNSPNIKYNSYTKDIEGIFYNSVDSLLKGERTEIVLNKLMKDINELAIKRQP